MCGSRTGIGREDWNHQQSPHGGTAQIPHIIKTGGYVMSFKKITEEASLYNDLEHKSVEELLQDINTEDQKVALAVQKTIPQIAKLVKLIVPRMKQGGRIFYRAVK